MNEIPILIDPASKVDAAALQAAWARQPQARQWGRLEARAGGQMMGGLELVIIPALVSVGSALIAEGIKQMIAEASKDEPPRPVTVIVQRLPNGQEAIVVQEKPPESDA